jgi:hypothetical protein
MFSILSKNFVNNYINKSTPFSDYGLGEFVYMRTYSRIKENGENEKWYETIERVINGVFHLKYRHFTDNNIEWNNEIENKNAEIMYDLMFNIKFLPGGRGLWAMGTKITEEKHLYSALNNCAFVSTKYIDKEFSKPFEFLCDACMLGVGVGFDTAGAGKIIIHKPLIETDICIIDDTREGWVMAIRKTLNSYFIPNQKTSIIDYSKIRPAGTLLSTFGGTSSGPEPLKHTINKIKEMFDNNINKCITSRIIIDIMNLICLCVVAGNVRRSASIAMGNHDDKEFLELKNYDKYPDRAEYGWLSNNSISAKIGMNYSNIGKNVQIMGEPGLLWVDNMKKYSRMNKHIDNYDISALSSNPCGEITLENKEMCNLVEVFINRIENYKEFENVLQYTFMYAKSVSLGMTQWEETNIIIRKNRRIGCSLTGITNFIEKNGINNFKKWCENGYNYLKSYDTEISNKYKINKSIKITCVKPSGTISLLVPETCPGIHYPTAKCYIRRVRVNAGSQLIKSMEKRGYKVEDSINEPNTKIIEFPINLGNIRSIDEVSMWEQLELASKLQEWWADNQVSCTISFDVKTEGKQIEKALNYFQYNLKGISFLPRSDNNINLPQMPYEKITNEEFDKIIKNIDNSKIISMNKDDHETDIFCTSDTCIRIKNNNKKHIIIMNGIIGSGKSYIAKKINDYFTNSKNFKSIILSKDNYRYTDKGYIFNDENEKIVNEKYFTDLHKYMKDEKYNYIILDNTHINSKFVQYTFNELKQYKFDYIMLCIAPLNNINWYIEQNKHIIDSEKIKKQIEDWNINQESNFKKIVYHLKDNKHFNDIEIHNIIIKTLSYF